eukprot:scaffold20227_cov21-Prasinocladus_malaysianus.AAC.2
MARCYQPHSSDGSLIADITYCRSQPASSWPLCLHPPDRRKAIAFSDYTSNPTNTYLPQYILLATCKHTVGWAA